MLSTDASTSRVHRLAGTPVLWHYTCDHGRLALGEFGTLLPPAYLTHRSTDVPRWASALFGLMWATDLDTPWRDALGLTMDTMACDRTAHRYRVRAPGLFTPYLDARADLPARITRALEGADGAMPRHWWVTDIPAPVQYDPRP